MAKGEKQKRLSLTTIERAGLLFMAKYGHEKSKNIAEFTWFLETVCELGLPAIRKQILAKSKE